MMADEDSPKLTWDEARAVLGIAAEAADEEVRAAYLHQVRLHPPDRDPQAFEKIRDAYALLRDPALRAQQILAGPEPAVPLEMLLKDVQAPRHFAGAQAWLNVLKEKRP